VLNLSVVPLYVRRLRRTWFASSSRFGRSGMPSTRFRIESQSITAAVGQTFGVSAIEPSDFACARP